MGLRNIWIWFLAGVLWHLSHDSFAQSGYGKYIDVNVGYGTFLPHKQDVQHLKDGPSWVGEISYTLRTNGSKFHHKPHRLPYYGIVVGFAESGNQATVGYEAYISAFGGLPLHKADNPIVMKPALGLGFVQKPYDQATNPKQTAIGSHFNINFLLRFEKTFQLGKGGINLGLGISHYSNGSFQQPNLGLNYAHVYLGKRFQLKECEVISDTIPVIAILPYSPRRFEFDFNLGLIGLKQHATTIPDKYLLANASSYYIRQFSNVHSWSNGLDLFYNGALHERENKPVQVGISSTYIMNFGDFKTGLGLGAYVMGRPEISRGFYSTVLVKYYVNHRWYLKFNIKTHRAIADFFTFGFGYSL